MRSLLLKIAIYFVIINSSLIFLNSQLQGQDYLDSLLVELPNMKEDTNRVNLLLDIAYEYIQINPVEGLEYCEKGINLSKKLKWRIGEAKCLDNIAFLHLYGKSDFTKAIEYFQESMSIYEEIGDNEKIADNFTNIGTIYGKKSEYSNALDNFHEALKIYEKTGNKLGIAKNFANIGNIYQSLIDSKSQQRDNYISKSMHYYNKAIKILNEIGYNDGVAQVYGNIATIFHDDQKFDEALENYEKSLQYYKENDNLYGLARNYGNMANLFVDTKKYEQAFEYYQNAIKLNEQLSNKADLANNLGNIGKLYSEITIDSVLNSIPDKYSKIFNDKKMNLELAEHYLKQSIAIFEELDIKNSQSYFLQDLSIVYERLGNYQASLDAFRKYTSINDSLFSSDIDIKIATMEKDSEIKLLQSKQEKRKLEMYLLLGGILVLITALVFSYLRFKEKKMLSEKLIKKNQAIEEQKLLVEEKNEHIYSSIRYASTIQHAILPWDSRITKSIPDIFIFYKPKDIVSGDSYWFQEVEGVKFLAVIDCTGHGIPGSMLTVIASSVLDDAVLSKKLFNTSQILTFMNEKVTEVLNQKLTENSIRDGMEIALIAIHQDKIQFSGAGRPLYMKNETMEIIKTDKRGIAGQTDNDEYQFSSINIEIADNMMLYLTSDGFADQMNEQSKKYSTKKFVALLDSISGMSISEQYDTLENELNSHKGQRSQIDDITIVGVRL
ncbi:MAG: SpoIIE family protein phosphatase [Candidatus Kapabacteria bacterium]|nr:SpoIIE family protein phosphatase [Ignavibacteriota bacterium]MCW5886139.1 SpoIIE family protein phosphatase [Candidatus Kapabacteria bacterium]